MTQKNSSQIISVVHPICYGLDVHKDSVWVRITLQPSVKSTKITYSQIMWYMDPISEYYSQVLKFGL
jgi:hypothetical protein